MPIPLGVLAVAGAGAAGGGSAYDLLQTTVLTSDTRSVTFSGLGSYSAYKHLQVRMVVRSATNNATTMRLRVNGDSGSNYVDHYIRGTGSAAQTNVRTSQAQMDFAVSFVSRSDFTANQFGVGVLDVLDFNSGSKTKTFRLLAGFGQPSNSGQIGLAGGLWNSTSAMTSLELYHGTFENWQSGCRFSLYGIK
jgi:hypothetical protein